MAILVDAASRVLVQGITGREGSFHTERMLAAGTNVVAGTSPKKAGQTVAGVPVFADVAAAVTATGADVAVQFVPAGAAKAALLEAAEAGIRVVVCVTEGIPVHDMMAVVATLEARGVASSGPTAPVSPRWAAPTPASCRPTSSRPVRWASSRAAARSPIRSSTS